MTADAPEHLTHKDASDTEAESPYHVRLVARIPQPLDQRLRLLAAMSRKPVTHVLAEVLARALPTAEQLAEQMRGAGR